MKFFTMPFVLLILAILPGLFFVYRYYSKDIYKKEPWGVIWKSFFWGAIMVVPAGLIETTIGVVGGKVGTLEQAIIENFFIIAMTEELCKFIIIRFYCMQNINFDEMMDGIVYGAAVGSGFATFENIFYVMEHGFAVGLIRAVLSVPSHILEGALIGYWLARNRYAKTSLPVALIFGLGLSIFCHGLFDFSIQYKPANLNIAGVVGPVIFLAIIIRLLTKKALDFDLKYIHADDAKIITNLEQTESPADREAQDRVLYILNAGKKFVGVIFIIFSVLLFLGFIISFLDGKGNTSVSDFWIPTVPLGLGGYLFFSSRKKNVGA